MTRYSLTAVRLTTIRPLPDADRGEQEPIIITASGPPVRSATRRTRARPGREEDDQTTQEQGITTGTMVPQGLCPAWKALTLSGRHPSTQEAIPHVGVASFLLRNLAAIRQEAPLALVIVGLGHSA
jgi:hypothetical protein